MVDINICCTRKHQTSLWTTEARILNKGREADTMSSENSNYQNLARFSLPLEVKGETCGNLTVFPSHLPVSDSPYLPSSVRKPAIKKDLEEESLHCLPTTDKPSVPDWALSNWRSSQGTPGVRNLAPSKKSHIAHQQKALCSSGQFTDSTITPMARSRYYGRLD
jgi:hypothetical protein